MTAANIGTDLFDYYKKSNTVMKLWARDKIEVKCTAGCAVHKNFNFKTNADALLLAFTDIYDTTKTLCYIAGIGSLVCLHAIFYIIYIKKKAKQSIYMYTYMLVLLVTLLIGIWCIMLALASGTRYDLLRNKFKGLGGCV